MPLGIESQKNALMVANDLRMLGYKVDICYDDVKIGNMFKRAEKKQAKLAIIIGEEEIKNESVIIKNMESKEQITVALADMCDKVDELLIEHHCCGKHKHHEGECCQGEECEKGE